ncbi:uncharacterized protein LOC130676767 isoform X2 [Microplitis mediator]|uniref:uncharacterized protein LOC130676767 isoform X2 n=1 Tax=Microplitis mediator TaxID=375433 RepID=UPI002556DFCF|nr:uncharacterized protein LOC130676767 isoform X2 [Microplitis mediator]
MTHDLSNSYQDISEVNEDNIENEMKRIEKLDESINDLDLELKEVSNELSNLQLKNRQILKESLMSNFEIAGLAKNTLKYLNLYSIKVSSDDVSNHTNPQLETNQSNDSSIESCQDLSHEIKNSAVFNHKIFSITDEEKLQLESLLRNDSPVNKPIEVILENSYNQPNPYKFDEILVNSLKELDEQLESIVNWKKNFT